MKNVAFKKLASVALISVFTVFSLSACSASDLKEAIGSDTVSKSEESSSVSEAPEVKKAETINNEIEVLSRTEVSTHEGTLKEVKLHRVDGTVATCFIYQGKYNDSGGGLDCPEWAQDKSKEPINK